MISPNTPSTERGRRASRLSALALGAAAALFAPYEAAAHERWVPHELRFPIDRAYFQSMTGEVLVFTLAATVAVMGVIVLWYLFALEIVDALTPKTDVARAAEARRHPLARAWRLCVRFILDGPIGGRAMVRGTAVASFLFAKIPIFVLCLGAYEGFLIMPSYPLAGALAPWLRAAQLLLAVLIATGYLLPIVGGVMCIVYAYLCVAYGLAAIDATPVLASAFFYLFSNGPGTPVNTRQLLGMRVSMGGGFFLLGLINKIYLAELIIGVADQHPAILIGPQTMVPGLTRETWAFTSALGEMVFGVLLLFGGFDRIVNTLLAFLFINFMGVFGWAEIVHVYPVAAFMLLFFRGTPGTSLDGLAGKVHIGFWKLLSRVSSRVVYANAVTLTAVVGAVVCLFVPTWLVTEVVPHLAGTAVPNDYRPPPAPPPAAQWSTALGPPENYALQQHRHQVRVLDLDFTGLNGSPPQ